MVPFCKMYDKRDSFDFHIVYFPCLDGDTLRSLSCGVNISQLIRFASVSGNKVLTAKLLTLDYRYHRLRKGLALSKLQKYIVSLRKFCNKVHRNPSFMVT